MALLATCSTDTGRVAKLSTAGGGIAGQCPQPRETERAPDSYYSRTNPLPNTAAHLERGRLLYEKDAKPVACANCHGIDGDGKGPIGVHLALPPRNFSCAETMSGITDGQMYWVIENGSGEMHLPARQGAQEVERPGRRTRFTAMRAHKEQLSETDIWELILYIRTLQRDR
jgi:cytochrome c553